MANPSHASTLPQQARTISVIDHVLLSKEIEETLDIELGTDDYPIINMQDKNNISTDSRILKTF